MVSHSDLIPIVPIADLFVARFIVPTSILIPACVAAVKGKKSPLTGKQVEVIAAGGIYNGQGLAAALAFGASAVWVGTRFICSEEAGASKAHQEAVLTAGPTDTIRTIIYTVSMAMLGCHAAFLSSPRRRCGRRG